jgi:hypothetical protein
MKVSGITKNELVKVSQNYPDPYVRKRAIELLERRGEGAVEHRHMIMRDDNCGAWVCGFPLERHEVEKLERWLEAVVFQWQVEKAGIEAAKPASAGSTSTPSTSAGAASAAPPGAPASEAATPASASKP